MTKDTAEDRIDEALDRILKASGSALKYYTLPANLENMRSTMRQIMSESYINGSNDCMMAIQKKDGNND